MSDNEDEEILLGLFHDAVGMHSNKISFLLLIDPAGQGYNLSKYPSQSLAKRIAFTTGYSAISLIVFAQSEWSI